jgi:hypothetical protein
MATGTTKHTIVKKNKKYHQTVKPNPIRMQRRDRDAASQQGERRAGARGLA